MNMKIKNIVVCVVMAIIVLGMSALCLFMEKPDYLLSERREPEAFPEFSVESVMKDGTEYNDSFMSLFESYALDVFPFRDGFRTLKAICANYIFRQMDNNNIFISDGYAAELQYPINDDSISHASEKFNFIYNRYLKDKNINTYISIIPDKSYFLAEDSGHLSMDYEEFVNKVIDGVGFAEYIDIFGDVSIEDYYKTDTHWRQENLIDVAEKLVESMGGSFNNDYTVNKLDNEFYGVYYGQAALPLPSEEMYYLTNDNMSSLKVYDHQNRREISMYDMDKAYGKDPYDMYLSGELSMVTIENPNATTDKELIVFRDSYGRSIIPLMADSYAKITVVDVRYLSSNYLGNLIKFENQDVLFLYSTLVLNNSYEIK